MDKSIDISDKDIYKKYEKYVRNEPFWIGDLSAWTCGITREMIDTFYTEPKDDVFETEQEAKNHL